MTTFGLKAIEYAQTALDELRTRRGSVLVTGSLYSKAMAKHELTLDDLTVPEGETVESIQQGARVDSARIMAGRLLKGDEFNRSPDLRVKLKDAIETSLLEADADFDALDPTGKMNSKQVEAMLDKRVKGETPHAGKLLAREIEKDREAYLDKIGEEMGMKRGWGRG